MAISIKDRLNFFGTSAAGAAGTLPNTLYIGPGGANRVHAENTAGGDIAEGGEAGLPYFVSFSARAGTPTEDAELNVFGSPDEPDKDFDSAWPGPNTPNSAPATGWRKIGSLAVPKDEWGENSVFKAAVSDNKCKWLRVSYTGGLPTTVIRAFLERTG
jgi:hypothetical protein